MRVMCTNCHDVGEAEPGAPCVKCNAPYAAWVAATIPGLSAERGKYDDLVDRLFVELKAPGLVLLIVVDGPQGSGFSLAGEARRVESIPHWLRATAGDIERQINEFSKGGI